jgi:small subunit ribosomal protein S17e
MFILEVLVLGNIRQDSIKNIAHDLLEAYPKEFKNDDFQHNKLKVAELTDVKSIVNRNRIAGYITRILSPRERKTIGVFDDEQADL